MSVDKAKLALTKCEELETLIKKKSFLSSANNGDDNSDIKVWKSLADMKKFTVSEERFYSDFIYKQVPCVIDYGPINIYVGLNVEGQEAHDSTDTTDYASVDEKFTLEIVLGGKVIYSETVDSFNRYASFKIATCGYVYDNPTGIEVRLIHNKPTWIKVTNFALYLPEEPKLYSLDKGIVAEGSNVQLCNYSMRNGLDRTGADGKRYAFAIKVGDGSVVNIFDQYTDVFDYTLPADYTFSVDKDSGVSVCYLGYRNRTTLAIRYEGLGCLYSSNGEGVYKNFRTGVSKASTIGVFKELYWTPHVESSATLDSMAVQITDGNVSYGDINAGTFISGKSYTYSKSDFHFSSIYTPKNRGTFEFGKGPTIFWTQGGLVYTHAHNAEFTTAQPIAYAPHKVDRVVCARYYLTTNAFDCYLYVEYKGFIYRWLISYIEPHRFEYVKDSSTPICYGIKEFGCLYDNDIIMSDGKNVYFTREGDNFTL